MPVSGSGWGRKSATAAEAPMPACIWNGVKYRRFTAASPAAAIAASAAPGSVAGTAMSVTVP